MVVKETRKGVVHEHSQSVYEYGKVSEKEKGGEQANKLSTNKVCVYQNEHRACKKRKGTITQRGMGGACEERSGCSIENRHT